MIAPPAEILVASIGYNASATTVMITAGPTMKMFALNFSLFPIPCVVVAAIVVSEMKERLSPNIAPPTTIPLTSATLTPVLDAISIQIGIKAATVPIEVPIEKLSIQPIKNNPGRIMLAGKIEIPMFVTVSVACIPLATP